MKRLFLAFWFLAGVTSPGAVRAQNSVTKIIPVVGSTPGNFGSYFRTAVQLLNAFPVFAIPPGQVQGRFIFHPAGVVGSPSDPSLPFSIGEGATLSYDDIVQSMGQTGLGSLDVELPSDASVLVVTRVFNDGGASGTSGFTEEPVGLCYCGQWVDDWNRSIRLLPYLIAPADPTRFRFNIGVRTLDSGATLQFTVVDASGNQVQQISKTFGANYFTQQSAAALLEVPLLANYSISITGQAGSAIVYGATTDNTTNDSSIQATGEIRPSDRGI